MELPLHPPRERGGHLVLLCAQHHPLRDGVGLASGLLPGEALKLEIKKREKTALKLLLAELLRTVNLAFFSFHYFKLER